MKFEEYMMCSHLAGWGTGVLGTLGSDLPQVIQVVSGKDQVGANLRIPPSQSSALSPEASSLSKAFFWRIIFEACP